MQRQRQRLRQRLCRLLWTLDRKTNKKTFEAFDFYKAKADYESYVAEKAEKDADRAAKKAEKIANDKKKREETSEF